MFTITFSHTASLKETSLIIGIYEDNSPSLAFEKLNKELQDHIKKTLETTTFKGKKGDFFSIIAPQGTDASMVAFIGLGKKDLLSFNTLEEIGGNLLAHLYKYPYKRAAFHTDGINTRDLSLGESTAHLAQGSLLRSFQFDKYKTKKREEAKSQIQELTFVLPSASDEEKAKKAFIPLNALAEGIFYARNLISEPANVLNPETYAQELKSLEKEGIKVTLLGEKEMQKLGMNALLGVGQGSSKESHLVIMEWNGAEKTKKPIAFVGKGVTFDSGGLSLKPTESMVDMKWDMGGSAIVSGLIKELALRKAKVNAVGVVGLVENMPSGTAQRPSDIVKSMSGQTIEVLDTDAEGRLVLSDALWYTQEKFHPEIIIDLATLTGAIIIALGSEYAGLFSNDDILAKRLEEAGLEVEEKVWRMPLHETFDKDIDSDIADIRNLGTPRKASSSTAAQFLLRFINNIPWAHLDIAGVTWSNKDKPLYGKGATGFGIRLLDRFISKHYEGK